MPAPTTADEVLDLVQKSGLVEEARLSAHVQKLRDSASFPADPGKLAAVLVRDGLLTYFQAEQLLQGKYKRFNLGKYKVLEKLGSGGMGTVFLCEHKLMRRRVAVKVLPIPKAEDRASLDRFYREARAVAAVDHPNIVRAYDIDQDENLHFLVMEWVDGTNLQDLVKKFGPLDPLRACHYIYGAAVGLQHAYEIGLVHRDIKPGNILIDRTGVVKILDLGLARLTHDTDDNLTRQNDENVLGTADYLAPEQAMDSHTVTIQADIYSLGATFYFLLSGSAPFPEGSVAQKLIWHQNRPPRPLKSLRSDAPDDLCAIVETMMAKDPKERYQTPADVMAALAGWVSTPIPPPSERELPTLSPAVANALGRSPSLAANAGQPSLVARPMPAPAVAVIPQNTGIASTPPPAAQNTPPAFGNVPAVWSDLDSQPMPSSAEPEHSDATLTDTSSDEEATPKSRRQYGSKSKSEGRGKVLLFALFGAMALIGAGVGVYFAFFNKPGGGGTVQPPPRTDKNKYFVSKTGGENTYGTLREALNKAGPGDTIVIVEPRTTETALKLDRNRHKELTIESATADGKPAVIESGPAKGGVMFDANYAEGLRLRNLEFDGKGTSEIGIQLSGVCANTTLENVTIRNVTKNGIHLWNLAGESGRPITLDRVRVLLTPTMEAGVVSFATNTLDNKFITIKNSRFEGPGRAGVRIDGPVLDFEMTNNRFYNVTTATAFTRPGGKPSKGTIANNTIYQAAMGVQFEVPANEQSRYDFKLSLNYFAKTNELLKTPSPIIGLITSENFHDPGSNVGTPPMVSARIEAPALPNPNPNDDATFLRFPAAPPMSGNNRAGAN
jgi:serine/threonine protein kinase